MTTNAFSFSDRFTTTGEASIDLLGRRFSICYLTNDQILGVGKSTTFADYAVRNLANLIHRQGSDEFVLCASSF